MKRISKRQEQEAATILREFTERVDLSELKEIVLELNVYALREKEDLGAKRRKVSLMNGFVSFLDKIETWQAHNQETKWKD